MGQSYTIRRVCHSSNVGLYSRFMRLNGPMTPIRAETERYDIARFCMVATDSLATGTGSYESNELGEGKTAGEL